MGTALPGCAPQNLLSFDWQRHEGPGGHNQWRPVPKPGAASNATDPIAMLTTDVALLKVRAHMQVCLRCARTLWIACRR